MTNDERQHMLNTLADDLEVLNRRETDLEDRGEQVATERDKLNNELAIIHRDLYEVRGDIELRTDIYTKLQSITTEGTTTP